MKILNIKKINLSKYEIALKDSKHIIYGDVLLKYNLLQPKEVTSKQMQDILNDNNFYEIYNKMIRYCSFKKRCTSEVIKKLSSFNVDNHEIIKKLTENNYLNDENFVKSYINDAINTTLKGPKKILNELKSLGFSDVILPDIDLVKRCELYITKKLKVNKTSALMFKNKMKKELLNLGYDEKHFNDILDSICIDDSLQKEKEYQKLFKKYSLKYEGYVLDRKIKEALYKKGY